MIENPLIAEFVGTAVLLLLGAGVVANVNLKKTYGENETPLVLITSAWGFAVFVGVFKFNLNLTTYAIIPPTADFGVTACNGTLYLSCNSLQIFDTLNFNFSNEQ